VVVLEVSSSATEKKRSFSAEASFPSTLDNTGNKTKHKYKDDDNRNIDLDLNMNEATLIGNIEMKVFHALKSEQQPALKDDPN